jgi:hypothetical protein
VWDLAQRELEVDGAVAASTASSEASLRIGSISQLTAVVIRRLNVIAVVKSVCCRDAVVIKY